MKVGSVTFFTNGMTMAFDEKGEQISKLQGFILDAEIIDKLKKHCNKDTKFYFADWNKREKLSLNIKWWFDKA